MLMTLAQVLGPVAEATAKAQSAMVRVTSLYAEMNLALNTRLEAGQVATQNATEAEIQRRQVTRSGAQSNLVGVQNQTERAMTTAVYNALSGQPLRGVGTANTTQAEIYRRMVTAFVRLPTRPTGAGRF
jgi:hypothetical protein